MKLKTNFNLFYLVAVFFSILAISCSSSDDGNDDTGGGGQALTSIALTSNASTVLNGSQVAFLVVDNLSNDVTANSTFTIDGNAITSNPYTFTAVGTYQVEATYSGLTSNVLTINVAEETAITLTFSSNPASTTESVYFTVVNNLGMDVTSQTTFALNAVTITNPYQFTDFGDNIVQATYNGLMTSETINVERGFTKKVLLEDFTGTWCPNCPPAASAVASQVNGNTKIFGVGYHDGFPSYPDPMEIAETGYWANYYNVTGFPTVYVNGPDTRWNYPAPTQINNELAEVASVGLAIDAQMVGGLLNVEVKVGFKTIPTEEVKIMLYLLEDDVTTASPQSGSSQGASYVHHDVLREVYTNQLGDVIPAGSISLTSDYVRNFTGLTLPSNIDDMSKVKVMAFVRNTYEKTFVDYFNTTHVDSPHYDIYNVQEVALGSSIDFD